MKIGNKIFQNYTYVMAILNLTPDSFYSPSRQTEYTLLKRVEEVIKEGASLIDLGAQSTRPGYTEVSPEQEEERLLSSVYAISQRFDIPISVDTYFAKVANSSLQAGAHLINDIWGLSHDEDMAQTIARYHASVCIMHNAKQPVQGNVMPPVISFLQEAVQKALQSGIEQDKICLDGGIGFAKSVDQNWQLLRCYPQLSALGYPLLLGTSRKSMFGGKVEDRLLPTLQSTEWASQNGVLFVRVHDVKENYEVIERVYQNKR